MACTLIFLLIFIEINICALMFRALGATDSEAGLGVEVKWGKGALLV
jgi:hypothetical protein